MTNCSQKYDYQSKNVVLAYASESDHLKAEFLEEARIVANMLECDTIVDEMTTSSYLKSKVGNARYIHIVSHGLFDQHNSFNSSIELADGDFTALNWMQTTLQSDLVTLSACQTGISKRSVGDELTGIAQSILYAGSSSTLLTLWSVHSSSTLSWMQQFYESLPKSKLEAFRTATLKIYKQTDDPYYWAPFMLIGY